MAPAGSLPCNRKPTTSGTSIESGWGLGLDATHAPAEHTETVDHRGVRVGAYERIRVGAPLAVLIGDKYRTSEVFEVHLVADSRTGRHHAEVAERALSPTEKSVAFLIALELAGGVYEERGFGAVLVYLDRVVDHEVGGLERVDLRGIAAERRERVAHGRQIHHGGDAGEVLQEDSRRAEGDLLLIAPGRVPLCERLDVLTLDEAAVLVPREVLEEDLEREGEAVERRAGELGESVESEDRVRCPVYLQDRAAAERVERIHHYSGLSRPPCGRGE